MAEAEDKDFPFIKTYSLPLPGVLSAPVLFAGFASVSVPLLFARFSGFPLFAGTDPGGSFPSGSVDRLVICPPRSTCFSPLLRTSNVLRAKSQRHAPLPEKPSACYWTVCRGSLR